MSAEVIKPEFDLKEAIAEVSETGYFFSNDVLTNRIRQELQNEIDGLPLELGNHVSKPINADKPNEVRQQHERYYIEYGTRETPVANFLIDDLASSIRGLRRFTQLAEWRATEIGYQRYRHGNDFIGAHRDRASDRLLSVTFTIAGSAVVRIFETQCDASDYTKLKQTDEFLTTDGSIMLLRAPGFGNGEQIVHEVLPPLTDSRSILNLRMRPTILDQPTTTS